MSTCQMVSWAPAYPAPSIRSPQTGTQTVAPDSSGDPNTSSSRTWGQPSILTMHTRQMFPTDVSFPPSKELCTYMWTLHLLGRPTRRSRGRATHWGPKRCAERSCGKPTQSESGFHFCSVDSFITLKFCLLSITHCSSARCFLVMRTVTLPQRFSFFLSVPSAFVLPDPSVRYKYWASAHLYCSSVLVIISLFAGYPCVFPSLSKKGTLYSQEKEPLPTEFASVRRLFHSCRTFKLITTQASGPNSSLPTSRL